MDNMRTTDVGNSSWRFSHLSSFLSSSCVLLFRFHCFLLLLTSATMKEYRLHSE